MNRHALSIALSASLLCVAAPPVAATATVITVGGDIACDHASLESALAAAGRRPGHDTIRVARNYRSTATTLEIADPQLRLVGGYANCHCDHALGVTRVGYRGEPLSLVGGDGQSVLVDALDATGVELDAQSVGEDALGYSDQR